MQQLHHGQIIFYLCTSYGIICIFAVVTASAAIFAVVTELLARSFAPNVSISPLTTPYAIVHPTLDTSAHPPVVLYTKSTLSPTSLNVMVEPFAKVVGVRVPSPPSATIVIIFI